MKKKELAEYLDELISYLDKIDMEPRVRGVKGKRKTEEIEAALPTKGEITCIRLGAIGALVLAQGLLNGDIEPHGPRRDAQDFLLDAIALIIDTRLEEGEGQEDD
jgi:hypothetical protein